MTASMIPKRDCWNNALKHSQCRKLPSTLGRFTTGKESKLALVTCHLPRSRSNMMKTQDERHLLLNQSDSTVNNRPHPDQNGPILTNNFSTAQRNSVVLIPQAGCLIWLTNVANVIQNLLRGEHKALVPQFLLAWHSNDS